MRESLLHLPFTVSDVRSDSALRVKGRNVLLIVVGERYHCFRRPMRFGAQEVAVAGDEASVWLLQ